MFRRKDFNNTRSWAIALLVLALTPECKWAGAILLAGAPLFWHALHQPGALEHWRTGAVVFAGLMMIGVLYATTQTLIILGTGELVSRRTTPIREMHRLSRALLYKAKRTIRDRFNGVS